MCGALVLERRVQLRRHQRGSRPRGGLPVVQVAEQVAEQVLEVNHHLYHQWHQYW